MAECELDLSHPCFLESIERLKSDPDFQNALDEFKEKVQKEHTSCNRVVQKFYGNKKFTHLHGKIWKYDWGESSASGRKSWRLVIVVPDPDIEPLRLIAGAMYTKNLAAQLPLEELAAIFARVTAPISLPASSDTDPPTREFRRVSNGDEQTRSICPDCFAAVAVSLELAVLEKAEREHCCSPPKESN